MKKIILLLFALVLIVSCTKQPYYEIPLNADGTVYLTKVPVATSPGISTLDGGFTVTAQFVTAKSGDIMNVQLLILQAVTGQSNLQLLPMAGTDQAVTVDGNLKASVTYTRATANLLKAGDYVTIVFNGANDYAKYKVTMFAATTVSIPMVGTKTIDVARTSEVANFHVAISPVKDAYTGTLTAQFKHGVNGTLGPVTGTPFVMAAPYISVPISGDDFAAMQDTNYYVFTTVVGSYTDIITYKVIVRDPYFYLKKATTLTIGGQDAVNVLVNGLTTDATAVAKDAQKVIMALRNPGQGIVLTAGTPWIAANANNSLGFVASDMDVYNQNSTSVAIADYEAGVTAGNNKPDADPRGAVYIFKAINNGTTGANVYYGMIKFISSTPNSVSIEYRIGNQYAHLLVIQ